MNPFTRQEAARPPRGLRWSLVAWRARVSAWLAAARAWQWGSVVGRVVLAALGLLLLGAIGRSALARNALLSDPSRAADAGSVIPPPPSAAPPAALASASQPAPSAPVPATSPALLSDNAAPTSTAAPAASGRPRATPDDPVYLNEATLADLHRLPGVGPKRAEAILALRSRLGHFRQIEDLLKVKGIGRSSLRKLRPLVRLDPPPMKSGDAAVDARAAL